MAAVARQSTSLVEFYNEVWSIRDERVENWLFMASPWPTLVLCAIYYYIALVLGPAMMKDRPAFKLTRTIQVYNLIQVILSAYVVYETFASGWMTTYSWSCQDVDRSMEPGSEGLRMASACHVYFLCKFTEFFDTFFFIARKKFGHVSALQLVHHGIMPIYAYLVVRWVPGGQATFGGTFNSIIHVIMYSYYFLATLGPAIRPYLWWKRYLTLFQMVQFVCIFVHSLIVITGVVECGFPWKFSVISACLVATFFILFAQFYAQEYNSQKKAKQT